MYKEILGLGVRLETAVNRDRCAFVDKKSTRATIGRSMIYNRQSGVLALESVRVST